MERILRTPDFWRTYLDTDRSAETASRLSWPATFDVTIGCGARHSLRVRYTFDPWRMELTLIASDTSEHILGWWDDARWHPYALRWEELTAIHHYQQESGGVLLPEASLLLLAPFVGTGTHELGLLPARQALIAEALRSIGISDEAEALSLSQEVLQPPSDDDYAWAFDPELGWTFGGTYPCYSLRNAAHCGDSEPRFPFRQSSELLADVGFAPA